MSRACSSHARSARLRHLCLLLLTSSGECIYFGNDCVIVSVDKIEDVQTCCAVAVHLLCMIRKNFSDCFKHVDSFIFISNVFKSHWWNFTALIGRFMDIVAIGTHHAHSTIRSMIIGAWCSFFVVINQ